MELPPAKPLPTLPLRKPYPCQTSAPLLGHAGKDGGIEIIPCDFPTQEPVEAFQDLISPRLGYPRAMTSPLSIT